MTMSAADFLRPVVRDRSAEGDDVGVGHHRHVPGSAVARAPRTCCSTTTWARSTARSARGASRRAARAASRTRSRSAARSLGVEIRTEAPVARIDVQGRPRDRRHAGDRRGRSQAGRGALERRLARDVPQAASSPATSIPTFARRGAPLQVPGLERQGEPRARRAARARVQARRRRVAARRDQLLARASTTWSARTTTRSTAGSRERPYIDCIIPTLVDPSMAPPGKHMMSCFVQYAPYHLEPTARSGTTPSATRSARP